MEKILIIDDSVVQAQVLRQLLDQDYTVEICSRAQEAFAHAARFEPSVILLDVIMPELSGFEVLAQLKGDALIDDIPVILISSISDVGHEKQGLDLGAVDYIVKPYSPEIVKARVRTHVRIYSLQRSLEKMMQMDALTGVYNRRYIEECLRKQWQHCQQEGAVFSLGLLDIDFFKQYNDHYGHLGGDAALRIVAQVAEGILREEGNFIARYGGEEFLFGMQGVLADEAELLADWIRAGIAQAHIAHERSQIGKVLTVSVGGMTAIASPQDTLESWISQVDALLYRAKREGRNRSIWKGGPSFTEANP